MTSSKRPRVFGAGLIALDLVIGPDPTVPVCSWAGGTCGNVLSILAYLGWDVYPIARMSDDPASERVRSDMARWGVKLDWANCAPATHTTIIVQEIRRDRNGRPTHRFSWACPHCGRWLPTFKAVTLDTIASVRPALIGISVFFFDRLSRATLALAAEASAQGAVVAFEPSGKAAGKLMAEAVSLAHIVKYADERLVGLEGAMAEEAATVIEVQTQGEQGLRYRHRLGKTVSNWISLDAVSAPRLVDTCGSRDWCTAGLLAELAAGGQDGLLRASANAVQAALRYGQALAAWNCGFEGARGGMYVTERSGFESQLRQIVKGEFECWGQPTDTAISTPLVACPACPLSEPASRTRRSSSKQVVFARC
jgi:sugar/nucleoside kinase (ribokinase family)